MAPHDTEASSREGRKAALARNEGSGALGACLYLTSEDLESLGVDPDADAVQFRVDESTGQLEVEEVLEER